MNKLKKKAFIAFSSMFMLANVNAATCGYEEKAKLNNEIANVKSNYEIKERTMSKDEYSISDALLGTEYEDSYESTTEYIQVNILNLTENMYVEISNDYNDEVAVYQYSDTQNGNISFNWQEIDELVTYTIKVYASDKTGCEGSVLKTLYQALPRYNDYSTYDICKNIPDYYLCQRYVTYEDVGFDVFTERVFNEVEKKLQKEEQQTKENEKWYKKVQNFVKEHKVPFIIGGVVLVVAAGGTTFVIIKKRRRSII